MNRTFLTTVGIAAAMLVAACSPSAPSGSSTGSTGTSSAPAASTSAPAAKPASPAAAGGSPVVPAPSAAAGQALKGSLTFGVMAPLTGPASAIGTIFSRGLNMAVDEINASGGAGGLKLVANVQDHKGTAQGGTEAMNQLVNIAHVPYVISTFSGPSLVAQPIAAQNHVLLINAGGTDPSLLNKPDLYNDQVMANNLVPPLAKYAWDHNERNVAMITSNDAYGDGSRKAFRADWEKLGGKIVGDEVFQLNATDFTAQLTKIKAANPDGLMIVAVGQTQGLIIKQARALGINAQLYGPLSTADAIATAGPAAEGFIDSGIAVDPSTTDAGAKHFIDAYKQKYGTIPDWSPGTMYESVYLLRDLVEEVQKQGGDPNNGAQLLKALQASPKFHNYLAGGTVMFQQDHAVLRKLELRQVKNKEFQTIQIVDATAG